MLRALLPAITSTLCVALAACSSASAPDDDAGIPSITAGATRTAAATITPVPSQPCDPAAGTVFCAEPAPMQAAAVLDVVDGDTFDALIDGTEERIRLFGVDTPERGDPCYREATEALRGLIGSEVRLLADVRNRDGNGRLLRYVYTPQGLSIDAALIGEGFAVAWTRDGALRDALVQLEQQARAERRGCLWD